LTSETRAGSTLSQPAATNNDASAVKVVAAATQTAPAASPAAKTPATLSAATQRTAYQQPHGSESEPAPAPPHATANRLLSQYETANRAYVAEPLAPAMVPEHVAAGDAGCTNCGPHGGCDQGGCNPCGCDHCCSPYFYTNGWYAGAEYRHMRPNFSSPAGAVQRTTVIDPNTNASTITDEILEYEIDYDSTYRLFGGYRWGECGESLELSFWRLDTGEAFTSPPATDTIFFASFEEAIADGPGEILSADFNMELDVFDIDYSKRTSVHTDAGHQCGACCPAWDWGWSLGARIADYKRTHENSVINAAGALVSAGETVTIFRGAGPRAGLEARRYFGDEGKWSAYGNSHFSLLLGDYENSQSRVAGITTSLHFQDFIRTVPVAELEFGLARQIGCRTMLTAGYQFQAWWEIGRFDTILIGDCECLTSSNVLSLDGFFVRLEHTFGSHGRRRCN
jgi:hypothetical protein